MKYNKSPCLFNLKIPRKIHKNSTKLKINQMLYSQYLFSFLKNNKKKSKKKLKLNLSKIF